MRYCSARRNMCKLHAGAEVSGGGLDVRLQLLHLLHRLHVRKLQRKQKDVDEDGDYDDRPAVVVNVLIVVGAQSRRPRGFHIHFPEHS